MKIQIDIKFICGEDEYYGCSEVIEWNLPLPVRGDLITLADDDNSIKMKYSSVEEEKAIEGNAFDYKIKNYHCENGEIIIQLMFGDWDF